MKKLKKIISAVLSAAVMLTAFSGITVSAADGITGAQLKIMAESRKLVDREDAEEILSKEYIENAGEYTLEDLDNIDPVTKEYIEDLSNPRETKTIWDIPGIENAFGVYGSTIEKLADEIEAGASLDDAVSGTICLYYIPGAEKYPDRYGEMENVSAVEIYAIYTARNEDGSIVSAANSFEGGRLEASAHNTAIYDFDSSYDKFAQALNQAGCKSIDSACIIYDDALAVSTDVGCMIVSPHDKINLFSDNKDGSDDIKAFNTYKINDYVNITLKRQQDAEEAYDQFYKKLRSKMPDSIDPMGYTFETTFGDATDSFSKYIGAEPRYSDITAGQAAVTNQLSDLGVITGMDGMFCPDSNVTRAETAAMICRLFGIEPTASDKFTDVPQDHWAAGYIGALSDIGVIAGTSENLFSPNDSVTYEQALKIIETMMGYAGDLTNNYGGYPSGFLKVALDLGLTDDLGSFDSGAPAKRIDIACILSRALDTRLVTSNVGIGMGAQIYEIADATLFGYLNGADLHGKLLRSSDEKEAFKAEKSREYAEKCGEIIDEWNKITGNNTYVKEINGIMMPNIEKYNPVPRITE